MKTFSILVAGALALSCASQAADVGPAAETPVTPKLAVAGVFAIEGGSQIWLKTVVLNLLLVNGQVSSQVRIVGTPDAAEALCEDFGYSHESSYSETNAYPLSAHVSRGADGKLMFAIARPNVSEYAIDDLICLR